MKLEKKIKRLEKNINLRSVFAMYSELKQDNNSLSLENLSVEFIVDTGENLNTFNIGISKFKKGVSLFKDVSLENMYITFNKVNGVYIPTISNRGNKNKLIARFFNDDNLNNWMINKIIEKLNMGVSFEINDGIFIKKDQGELRIIFGETFLNRRG